MRHRTTAAPVLNRTLGLLAAASIFFVCGCAEIGAPPGGEVDRLSPNLLMSIPVHGATMVPVDSRIEIVFSERITKPDKGDAIFVSPRPSGETKVDWKSDRVVIDLGEPLQPNRTYVITVSSELADLRNNRLDSAITVAFSTGDQLDTGSTSGRLLDAEGNPLVGWLVGLYRHLEPTDLLVIDSIYPDYLTSSARNGRFHFQNLPDDYYLAVGFQDKNRNELFEATREPFALTDRKVDLLGPDMLANLLMTSGIYDTIPPTLVTARYLKDNLVALGFDRKVDATGLAADPSRVRLRLLDSTGEVYAACGLFESDADQIQSATFAFGALPDGTYKAECELVQGEPALTLDSISLIPSEDKQSPKMIQFQPGKGRHFADQVELSLAFSEPLDTAHLSTQSLTLWEDSLKTLPVAMEWRDCFRLELTPVGLAPGHSYRLEMTEFDFVDLSGNQLGDSLQTHVLSTHNADSLGSIAGQVTVNLADPGQAAALLEFRQVGSKTRQSITVEQDASSEPDTKNSRPYSLAVPPGKYLVTGFLDSNGDGRLTPGTISPYRLGETRMIGSDTITVRARFETADVQIVFD